MGDLDMCIKKRAEPSDRRNGNNSKGHSKYKKKILVRRKMIGDYAALLEVYYSDGGQQYRTEVFTKELDILENEAELKIFIGGIVAAQRFRRSKA